MNSEELERLYMDIYDNGIPDYDYKEKFKRYVNNRLEVLEKEIAELKEGNKELQKLVQQREQRGLEVQKDLLKEKEELEKKNEELKSIADFQTSSNMDRYFQLKRKKEQLTKAKEIIENLMVLAIMDFRKYEEAYKEAERFLSEVKG